MAVHLRRQVLVATLVAVLVLAAVVAWVSVPVHQKREVAVPDDDAGPEVVVRAFLDAWDARDCATVRTLWQPNTGAPAADPGIECRAVAEVTAVTVESPRRAGDLDVYVPVHFDIAWRWWHQDSGSFVGPTTWGYAVHRDSLTSPWRLAGGGVG